VNNKESGMIQGGRGTIGVGYPRRKTNKPVNYLRAEKPNRADRKSKKKEEGIKV